MNLSLVTLRARDLEVAAAFFTELGLRFVRHSHGGPEHYCAESDGLVFEIHPLLDGEAPTRGTRLGFDVVEAEATIARLVAAGGILVRPLAPSRFGNRAVVRDPEGHAIEIRQLAR